MSSRLSVSAMPAAGVGQVGPAADGWPLRPSPCGRWRAVIADAIDNPNSFDRVPTYWLPTIRSLGVNVPVILIGNKSVERAAAAPRETRASPTSGRLDVRHSQANHG